MNTESFPKSHVLAEKSGLLHEFAAPELIGIGAVYVNSKRSHNPAAEVHKGDLIKIHLKPKRYPFSELSFQPRVVFESSAFSVIDKPSPLPVHATSSNSSENLIHFLEQQSKKNYFVTSRLDADTEGLIILAHSKESQEKINQLFRAKKIKKLYTAITRKSPPLGLWRHYQSPEAGHWRAFEEDQITDKWKLCELIVHSSTPCEQGYQSEIELMTGRTHQIRGQYGLMGCPIIGDRLYGSPSCLEKLMLECSSLEFFWEKQVLKFKR